MNGDQTKSLTLEDVGLRLGAAKRAARDNPTQCAAWNRSLAETRSRRIGKSIVAGLDKGAIHERIAAAKADARSKIAAIVDKALTKIEALEATLSD